jgi:polysaccharide pyruvyl transferase WcaK-like protein
MMGVMKALTLGPHGGENLGDELILSSVAAELGSRGFDVTAMSSSPDLTVNFHGLPAVQAVNVKHRRFSTLRNLRDFDLIVVAGGEQIAPGRYQNPFWGHLANIAVTSAMARRQGVAFAVVGVGAEEINTRIGRSMLRRVLRNAVFVSARDQPSRDYLEKVGRIPVYLTADPVFKLEQRSRELARTKLSEQYDIGPGPVLLFCPADDHRVETSYVDFAALEMKKAAEALGGTVLVKAMESQSSYDPRLLARTVFDDPAFIRMPLGADSPSEVVELIAGVDQVTSARMHPLIVAATQGTPWISLNRNRKLADFARPWDSPALPISQSLSTLASLAAAQVQNGARVERQRLDALVARVDGAFDALAQAVGK